MLKIFRAKIVLDYHRTEEENFGLIHEYSPTFNRKNEASASVDEVDCGPNDNFVVNDHMDLGEEFYSVTMGVVTYIGP